MKILRLAAGALISGAIAFACASGLGRNGLAGEVQSPGNILIADQFNNRVIEADKNGNIVCRGVSSMDSSANSILA